MTNILELLKNEKVEWKKLGEVKEIKVISAKTKLKKTEYNIEGKYPIIDQGQDFIVGYTNRESALFDLDEYVIFGDHTESVKYVDFRFAQGADGIKVLKANESYIKPRYLYHVILNFVPYDNCTYHLRSQFHLHQAKQHSFLHLLYFLR